MRKKVLLLTVTFLLSFTMGTITAQTTKGQKSPVTTVMAKKIGSYCQYNQRALSLFAVATPQQVRNRTDLAHRLLETLDKHLDCAENFIVTLYYNYGVEMAYFALKDAGFTIKETDIAETIFKKEKEKQDKITQEQEAREKAEREQNLLKRIEANDVFTAQSLSVQPEIEIDIANMATFTVLNDKVEYMDYDYGCIINKDGKLSLKNPSDTLNYSAMQKFIYHYITDDNIDFGGYKAGCIEIGGREIPVNSYINIHFNEEHYKHRGYLELTIKKDKKTGRWVFTDDTAVKLQDYAKEDAKRMRYDLEAAIYSCPMLNNLKGTLQLKIDVYRRVLKSNISDEIDLSYYFDMKYLKKSIWETEYVPLRYNVSF